jgi:hypothetical protein
VPLLEQTLLARSFLAGDILRLDVIAETQSPLQQALQQGPMHVINRYSFLVCLVPLIYVYCMYMSWRDRASYRLHYWICAIGGLSLLLMQARLHYFGSVALCIPLLLAAQQIAQRRPAWREYLLRVTAAGVLLMLTPPLRGQLLGPILPANDPYFINIREALNVLSRACKEDPGIVLADSNAGHQIRYYTDCDVMVDNFLLTAQHEEKVRQMERLFATPAADLPWKAPFVKYLFVRPAAIVLTGGGVMYKSYSDGVDHLVHDLLLQPHTDRSAVPSSYQLIYMTDLVDANIKVPYLALYKIQRETESALRAAE